MQPSAKMSRRSFPTEDVSQPISKVQRLSLPTEEVGGKGYNLDRAANLGCPTLPKYTIPTSVFQDYLNMIGLRPLLQHLDPSFVPEIKSAILKSSQPVSLLDELMQIDFIAQGRVAVRSSAVLEDSEKTSCAGRYDTFLNVSGREKLGEAIKGVWASAFNEVKTGQNFSMAVVIQPLVQARAAGVVSTIVTSNHYAGIQIVANFGLGATVVDGTITPDSWILHSERGYVLEASKGSKKSHAICSGEQGIAIVPTKECLCDTFCLTPSEVHEIAVHTRNLKEAYGCELDIEFAYNQEGKLYILQVRPLVALQTDKTFLTDPEEAKKHALLARGQFSNPGVATGTLIFIPSLEHLTSGKIRLSPTDIPIAYTTTNLWSQYLTHIGGLITCDGSSLSHPMLLSREQRIPCVVGINLEKFQELLTFSERIVTIDGHKQVIYEGPIPIKEAAPQDLAAQFAPIEMRPFPNTKSKITSWVKNGMVLQHQDKYWRKTPTYRVVGVQAEINLERFACLPELLGKKAFVEACMLDGFVVTHMCPYEEYVALFDGFSCARAARFNKTHKACMENLVTIAAAPLTQDSWNNYVETMIRFRAFVWLGGALQSYAEREVDRLGISLQLPFFYLEKHATVLQSQMPELDVEMHREICELAYKETHITDEELLDLGSKYRFSKESSLQMPVDIEAVRLRVMQEKGHRFTTSKINGSKTEQRELAPHVPELGEWLRISIENRILQSDSHHMEARANALLRPKLVAVAEKLIAKGVIKNLDDIFNSSRAQITGFLA